MATSTSRLTLTQPVGTDAASELRVAITNNATTLDDAAIYKEGTLVSRPAAGLKGRIYRATDDTTGGPNGTLYFDNGTSWNLLPTDAKGVVEPAFSTYRTLAERHAVIPSSLTSGTYILAASGRLMTANTDLSASSLVGALLRLDPAKYVAGTRSTKLNLRALMGVNTFAPAQGFTFALWAVNSFAGGAGNLFYGLGGSAVSGSSVLINQPPASAVTEAESGDFAFPSAGTYVIVVTIGGTLPANFACDMDVTLDVRQV